MSPSSAFCCRERLISTTDFSLDLFCEAQATKYMQQDKALKHTNDIHIANPVMYFGASLARKANTAMIPPLITVSMKPQVLETSSTYTFPKATTQADPTLFR